MVNKYIKAITQLFTDLNVSKHTDLNVSKHSSTTNDEELRRSSDSKRGRGRPRGRPRKLKPNLLPKGSISGGDLDFMIEVDAEWFTQKFIGKPPVTVPPIFITLQIAHAHKQIDKNLYLKRIFQHPQYTKLFNPLPWKIKEEGRRTKDGPTPWEGETPLPELLGSLFSQRAALPGENFTYKLRLTITMFYSFADVVAFLGTRLSQVLIEVLISGKSLRVGRGRWAALPHVISEKLPNGTTLDRQLVVSLRDLFGLEYESLQSTADTYNIPMPSKGLMDGYKHQMDVAYNDPKLRPKMIEYALGDLILAELWEAYLLHYTKICEICSITPQLPPPATKGALVAHIFQRVLNSTVKLPDDFHAIFDIPAGDNVSLTHILKLYGCKALAKSDDSQTKQFLAIVHGGRVNNESPLVVRERGLVVSMDIVSCYGQALEHLYMPIGHPALFYHAHHHPHEWPTLRKFLERYRSELVEGCWYCVVDTCGELLSFPQNLLFSKHFRSDQPELLEESKLSDDWSEDLAHVKGDFMLLENEVRNGILTHYSLSVIEHCASSQELGELFTKLRVKAAMIYPSSLCVEYTGSESVEQWIDTSRNHRGKLHMWSNLKEHGVRDSRVGPWLKYPLGHFISPLLKRRRSLKAKMKQHSKDSAEWRRINAAQLSVKKVVNTLYGTLASIYFPISSPCVANNVTDRARTACWLMSVAGAGLTSITDGCESLLNHVRFYKEFAPSLATTTHLHMAHLLNERTRLRHWTAPLGSDGDPRRPWNVDIDGMITGPGLDLPVDNATAIKRIEELYDAHLRKYFTFSGLARPSWCDILQFECKILGLNIALHGSADYAIGPLPGETRPPLIKARGHRLDATHYHPDVGNPMESPMRTMMLNRLSGEPLHTRHVAVHYKPASVNEYRARRDFRESGGMPGYSIARHANVRLITLTEFNFPDLKSRLKWQQYYTYLNRRYGLGLEAAYLNYESVMTIEEITCAKEDIQRRIYLGESPGGRRVSDSVRTLKELGIDTGAPEDGADLVGELEETSACREDELPSHTE